MKTTRRLLALITVLALVLAMGTTAFAEGETPTKKDSITINNAKAGETYAIYKLFDLSVNNEFTPTAYTYTINTAWADFFKAEGETPAGAGKQYITVNDAGAVTAISDAAALAKAAANWTGKPTATYSVTVAEGATTAVFSNLTDGYWLVTSTLGTIAMAETTPDKDAVTITEKNPENTITKDVKEDSTSTYGASNDAQIGDTVEFESTITLVKGTRNVKVTDTMTSGLTYRGDAAIKELDAGNYTVTTTASGFEIVFTENYLNGLTAATTTLTLTYTATLNEKSVQKTTTTGETTTTTTKIVPQTNTIHITYGNAQSVDKTTTTTTHKFSVFKHATGSEDNLANAIFSLKKDGTIVPLVMIDATNYRVAKTGETNTTNTFTTVASGDIVIWGVDADSDYSLEEITPPAGYNKLTAEVDVTVEADNTTCVDVENKTGAELPSTGGMGTTIFYVLGGLMVLGALVVLVTNKRMRAN